MSDLPNNQLVVHTAGTYLVEGRVDFRYMASATQVLELFILDNGDVVAANKTPADGSGTADVFLPVSGIVRLAARDKLTEKVFQSTGSSASLFKVVGAGQEPLTPVLQAQWLGP